MMHNSFWRKWKKFWKIINFSGSTIPGKEMLSQMVKVTTRHNYMVGVQWKFQQFKFGSCSTFVISNDFLEKKWE